MRLIGAVRALLLTFWVGSTWTVGYLVAPILFAALDERRLAGELAGRLFRAAGALGLLAGGLFLLLGFAVGRRWLRDRAFHVGAAMLVVAALNQFAVQPRVAALRAAAGPAGVSAGPQGQAFARWHGASAGLHLLQSLLGAGLVLAWRRDDWLPVAEQC